ncbi:hypothetical protein [Pseudoxanthomonas mexicana]
MNPDVLVRALPDAPEILAKLADGTYTLQGGVIRHAPGTGQGGQIVKHLIYPSDALQAQQRLQELQSTLANGISTLQSGMEGLQQSMNVLQGLQTANLVMTGLNLAVTTVGFVIVCKKLNKISAQIEAQSDGIARTLQLVGQAHERSLLNDEARFRSLILSTQQFCEQGDVDHLKSLIPQFHQEYQFTKLVLERHAVIGASNLMNFNEVELLQNRLVNLGLGLTHVQLKSGAPGYGRTTLSQMASDIGTLNANRIEALRSEDVATRIDRVQWTKITDFLKSGRDMTPSLTYQAEIIDLEARRPGLLQQAAESSEILLIAA